MRAIEPIPLEDIESARDTLRGVASRTPLLRLEAPEAPCEIWLKLECLQPIRSFKIRGAANVLASAPDAALARGVYTASAGNMAQGVGWVCRERGLDWSVVVPDRAPRAKLDAIERLGGRVLALPWDEWWQVVVRRGHPDFDGFFVHPVSDPRVIAGNATIGLEILEDLPDVDTVVVPFGGGGLATGVASALRAVRPEARLVVAEAEGAAPVAACLSAGELREVDHRPSFIDGCGSRALLPEMWPAVRELVAASAVVPLDDVAAAIGLLVRRRSLVAEGAGALPVAAALAGGAGGGRVACVVSGGNIDVELLASLLLGRVP